MKIDVRGKSFSIDLVNNWVHTKYTDMSDTIADLQEKADEVQELIGPTYRKQNREIRKDVSKLKRQVVEVRQEIVRELLESNGYEYDPRFWDREVNADDINGFVLAAITKDMEYLPKPKGKKK